MRSLCTPVTDPALRNELCKDFLTHTRAACMLASQ